MNCFRITSSFFDYSRSTLQNTSTFKEKNVPLFYLKPINHYTAQKIKFSMKDFFS